MLLLSRVVSGMKWNMKFLHICCAFHVHFTHRTHAPTESGIAFFLFLPNTWLLIARVKMFDQLPDLRFKLIVIIPKHLQIAESTYTRVIPLMMQFLVLKCVSTYTRGQLIHEYIRYLVCHVFDFCDIYLLIGI